VRPDAEVCVQQVAGADVVNVKLHITVSFETDSPVGVELTTTFP
jgi:hypothetical protein